MKPNDVPVPAMVPEERYMVGRSKFIVPVYKVVSSIPFVFSLSLFL